eukprot:321119-Pyramimonas_sp.AAC.1
MGERPLPTSSCLQMFGRTASCSSFLPSGRPAVALPCALVGGAGVEASERLPQRGVGLAASSPIIN